MVRLIGFHAARSTVMATLQDKLALIKVMEGVFHDAAKERRQRQEVVTDPCDPRWTLPGWVVFERERMHAAVNAERERRGLPTVEIKAIDRVERFASGHCDYASKYALYCTEIALGEVNPRQ